MKIFWYAIFYFWGEHYNCSAFPTQLMSVCVCVCVCVCATNWHKANTKTKVNTFLTLQRLIAQYFYGLIAN